MKTTECALAFALLATCATGAMGCGSSSSEGPNVAANDAGAADAAADGLWLGGDADVIVDAAWPVVDGGFALGDAGVLRADRFITKVVSFTPGECAGFGIPSMPGVVMGPPVGGGDDHGGTDVVSLGNAGEIVVSFEPNAIVDGPGVDLLVFENAFLYGNPPRPYAEPGEVSVSDDGVTWKTFACTATAYPYGACAGWHPVYSDPTNGISPVDPSVAGGDAFDLADVGLARARFVRVRDMAHETCGAPPNRGTSNGFDLDAMALVHAETM
jgi:hypothetical protein